MHHPSVSSALHIAMQRKHTEIVHQLVSAGAELRPKKPHERRLLYARLAVQQNDLPTVADLTIDAGTDLEAADEQGAPTALPLAAEPRLHACNHRHAASTRGFAASTGSPAPHRFARCCSEGPRLVRAAFARGWGGAVNAQDISGSTPLRAAVASRNAELGKLLLLREGGDVAIRDCASLTPLGPGPAR
ncbi:hypothetical protein MMC11_000435 [Xylographa trunciseda]|nr:hypothetical protein [Xylographa trunciseda]